MKEIINRNKIQYEMMGQDAIGSAGGIAMLWNPNEITFEEWVSVRRILTGVGRIVGTKERVAISGVYGPHTPSERQNFIKNIDIS